MAHFIFALNTKLFYQLAFFAKNEGEKKIAKQELAKFAEKKS